MIFERLVPSLEVLGFVLVGATFGYWGGVIGTLLLFRLLLPMLVRRMLRKRKKPPQPYRISWDDAHLLYESNDTTSRKDWSDFVRWRGNDDILLLFFTKSLFMMIPKRAFENERTCGDFEQLLAEKIGPEGKLRRN